MHYYQYSATFLKCSKQLVVLITKGIAYVVCFPTRLLTIEFVLSIDILFRVETIAIQIFYSSFSNHMRIETVTASHYQLKLIILQIFNFCFQTP